MSVNQMKRLVLPRANSITLAAILAAVLAFPFKGLAAGPAAVVTAPNGTPQSTAANTAFQVRLVAWVRDANTNPVPGVVVTFAAPSSGPGATFGGSPTTTVVTDQSGLASAPTLTANSQTGSYVVTATVQGVAAPASFALTNTAGNPSSAPSAPKNVHLVGVPGGGIPVGGVPGGGGGGGGGGQVASFVSASAGTPQSATVGTVFGTPLQATVTDSNSLPVSGVTVTFLAP